MVRVADLIGARDPGRARLVAAIAVSAGVLASALFASAMVHFLHADAAFLAMAVFLSVQAGNVVKGSTTVDRSVTAALLLPTIAVAVLVAALLSSSRPAVIAVFIVLTGVAMWVRRFGPRATALGTMGFLAYFFTLFMRPTAEELPAYCLIAVGAAATQLIARLVLELRRPRRQIMVLLTELRVASAAVLHASTHPERRRMLQARLERLDAVGHAITAWQHEYRTDRYIACSERELGERVLDARADTEEACIALMHAGQAPPSLAHLFAVLDEHSTPAQVAAATDWAQNAPGADDLIAQSTLAHARLRSIDLTGAHRTTPEPTPAHAAAPAVTHQGSFRWKRWTEWEPTTRLAVQAAIAALIATAAGEAISASRWYWAVLTAFVIFLGTTTRGGILTRAYRRLAGTVVGILVGVVAADLAHGNSGVLVGICVIMIFGMLYFGPLNYAYSSFFMTVMLVALYDMLGVLHGSILELRVEETIAGALIGVLCAYLILSSNSRSALMGTVSAYFDALDRLLQAASDALTQGNAAPGLLGPVRTLEAAQTEVDQTVSAMSAAFLVGRRQTAEETALNLMHTATRSATRFAQQATAIGAQSTEDTKRAMLAAIAATRATVEHTRADLEERTNGTAAEPGVSSDTDTFRRLDDSPAAAPLVRLDWAMRRLQTLGSPGARRVDRVVA